MICVSCTIFRNSEIDEQINQIIKSSLNQNVPNICLDLPIIISYKF